MLHLTLILVDTIIVASHNGDMWDVTCTDVLTGQSRKTQWTNAQLAAVVALGLAGEDWHEGTVSENAVNKELYKIAEPAVDGWPREVRPIP